MMINKSINKSKTACCKDDERSKRYIFVDINKWMPILGLGNVVKDPVSVSGGLLHRMYHVTTSEGEYAVKVLNPNIMQRPHALQNTIYSEKIAKAFQGLIPLIASLEIGGQQIQYMDGEYCLVFPWMDGASVFSSEITTKHCEAVGSILGKMHQSNLRMDGLFPEGNSVQIFPWGEILEKIFDKMPEMSHYYQPPKQDMIYSSMKVACNVYLSNLPEQLVPQYE